jgi:Alginate lyase
MMKNRYLMLKMCLIVVALCMMQSNGRCNSAACGSRVDVAAIDKDRILKAADAVLKTDPITITAFRAEHSSGGPNDYYSEGDYWWPDPANPDALPYINRDGVSNPSVFSKHRMAMRSLRDAVAALGAAYQVTGDDKYVEKTTQLLKVFFVDPETRMNPHMKYAQAVIRKSPGRGLGIIDSLHLIEIPQAISVMKKSPVFSPEMLSSLKKWFSDLSEWMVTSKNGIQEANAKNNHAVAFWLQIAVFASFTGDEAKLAECRRQFKEVFVPIQMAADGSFPAELRRTKPYGYSIFQLEIMVTLCHVLSTKEDNMWCFKTKDDKGIVKATEYLYPFLADKSKWPLKPDVQAWESWPSRPSCLLFAGLAFGEQKYLDLWKLLKPDPPDEEVKRNLPITQPILWIPQR